MEGLGSGRFWIGERGQGGSVEVMVAARVMVEVTGCGVVRLCVAKKRKMGSPRFPATTHARAKSNQDINAEAQSRDVSLPVYEYIAHRH